MDLPAPPRTQQEVSFFVEESACENCGKRGLLDGRSAYQQGSYSGRCVGCGIERQFYFHALPENAYAPGWTFAADAAPTKLFDAAQLAAITDRELALVPEPRMLPTLAAYDIARRHLVRARVAWTERTKFDPNDVGVTARLAALVRLYDEYVAAKDDVASKPGALPRPIGLSDRGAQHREWIRRGFRGDGQLVMRNESWSSIRIGTGFQHAILEDSTFTRADLTTESFENAQIRRCKFLGCKINDAKMKGAVIEDTSFADSHLTFANLVGMTVTRGDWQRSRASRSTWGSTLRDVDLREAVIQDAQIDDTVFERCDLRGADISHPETMLDALGHVRRTKFVDCDVRGMIVTGTRFLETTFERCQMQGIVGSLDGATIVGAQVDPEGDVADDPYDDARWLVFEDYLLQNEDPRSAVIRAEKAGDAKAAKAAVRKLEQLGEYERLLENRLDGSTWRAGYVVDAKFRSKDTKELGLLKALLTSPAARLMRSLSIDLFRPRDMPTVLGWLAEMHCARSLRRLEILNSREVVVRLDLAALPPRIEALSFAPRFSWAHTPNLARLRTLAVCPLVPAEVPLTLPDGGYPELRELSFWIRHIELAQILGVLELRVAPKLEVLRIDGFSHPQVPPLVGMLQKCAAAKQLRELHIDHDVPEPALGPVLAPITNPGRVAKPAKKTKPKAKSRRVRK